MGPRRGDGDSQHDSLSRCGRLKNWGGGELLPRGTGTFGVDGTIQWCPTVGDTETLPSTPSLGASSSQGDPTTHTEPVASGTRVSHAV